MSTAGMSMYPERIVSKSEERFVEPKLIKRHRVYYRAEQVEYSIHRTEWKVGMRVGVLEDRGQFTDKIPKPKFYTGVVEKIWGTKNDLVTIKYDAHPWAVNISFGIDNARFCILLPEAAVDVVEPKRGKKASPNA